jgi:uncharacterized membrane protein (UPF0127 family)
VRGRALLAAALLAAAACSSKASPPPGGVVLEFGRYAISAEVASSPGERELGLMFRQSLGRDAGMLFVFPPQASRGAFWMKNTLVPLSIAFMTNDGSSSYRVVRVMEMVPCRTATCPLYDPRTPYDAALEAPKEWFESRRIGPGAVGRVVGSLPTPS